MVKASLIPIACLAALCGDPKVAMAQSCANNSSLPAVSGDACEAAENTYVGTNWSCGLYGEDDSAPGVGVYGTSLYSVGVQGSTSTGIAVWGTVTGAGGYAVVGDANSGGQGGVEGAANTGYGVYGGSGSNDGVLGLSGAGATPTGIAGVVGGGVGSGVYGLYGASVNASGVYGQSNFGFSVGSASDAIYGDATNQTTGSKAGVKGESASPTGYGVVGQNDATSGNAVGVYGSSSYGYAIYGTSTSGWGVYGTSSRGNNAIWGSQTGTTTYANGVEGDSASPHGNGVYAYNSGGGRAVYGNSVGGDAVWGQTTTGHGVVGEASGTNGIGVYGQGGSGGWAGYFVGAVNATTGLEVAGTCRFGSCPSDRRLKQNIKPLTGALDNLLRLKGVTFDWRTPEDHGVNERGTQTGFIAQEVEQVFPAWVGQNDKGYKTLDIPERQMAALTVEAFRTVRAENEELRDRVKALENGTHPITAGMGTNGPWGVLAGMALGGALVLAGRRRSDGRS
jgi:hypothetical protein